MTGNEKRLIRPIYEGRIDMSVRLTKEMREFIPILRKNGYEKARTRGSHFIYINRTVHKHICINKDLNKMVRERLIKEYCLEV